MDTGKSKPTTIDEFIAQYPDNIQQILVNIRAVVNETAPEAVEKISYGMPAFYLNGGLVWIGVLKRHIGLYPRSPEMDASIEGLSAYKGTKGSVHFPLDQPIPYDIIRELVKYRIAENQKSSA